MTHPPSPPRDELDLHVEIQRAAALIVRAVALAVVGIITALAAQGIAWLAR